MQKSQRAASPTRSRSVGKLAVLMPGIGSLATTFIAGVELLRQKKVAPVGSITQQGAMKGPDGRDRPITEVVPLATLDDLVFGGWELLEGSAADAAGRAGVLSAEHLEAVRPFLEAIHPRPGVADPDPARALPGTHLSPARTHREKVAALRADIQGLLAELGAARAVMIFCASSEAARPSAPCHESLRALEKGLDASDPAISPTLLYAYAALQERVPFFNATANLSVETPALQELAREKVVPLAGTELKTGQALLKSVLGPMLKMRMLGLNGWASTVRPRGRSDAGAGALELMLPPAEHPELYPPQRDSGPRAAARPIPDPVGVDTLELFGWLNYPMTLQLQFDCRDSVLSAPVLLDLALLGDLAMRRDRSGVQEWLSFYFKSPTFKPGHAQEFDLFLQRQQLERELRAMNEELRRRPAVAASNTAR